MGTTHLRAQEGEVAHAAHLLLQPQVPGALAYSFSSRPRRSHPSDGPRSGLSGLSKARSSPKGPREALTEGAKCRCDAVWYGDTIAYGCKTCGPELI